MNGTNDILDRLQGEIDQLTPQTAKAATYVLENPSEVGLSTIRELAEAARVTPQTILRMAKQVGFDGYEDFRNPFREALKEGTATFPDRARWLRRKTSKS